MTPSIRYETEAFGVTSEGTTPGRHTSIEGFCLALSLGSLALSGPGLQRAMVYAISGSIAVHCPAHQFRVLGVSASTQEHGAGRGGPERAALCCPGFGAEPHRRHRDTAGGQVSPPAKSVSNSERPPKARHNLPISPESWSRIDGPRQKRRTEGRCRA